MLCERLLHALELLLHHLLAQLLHELLEHLPRVGVHEVVVSAGPGSGRGTSGGSSSSCCRCSARHALHRLAGAARGSRPARRAPWPSATSLLDALALGLLDLLQLLADVLERRCRFERCSCCWRRWRSCCSRSCRPGMSGPVLVLRTRAEEPLERARTDRPRRAGRRDIASSSVVGVEVADAAGCRPSASSGTVGHRRLTLRVPHAGRRAVLVQLPIQVQSLEHELDGAGDLAGLPGRRASCTAACEPGHLGRLAHVLPDGSASPTSIFRPLSKRGQQLVELGQREVAVEDVQHRACCSSLLDDLLLVASPTVSSSILPPVRGHDRAQVADARRRPASRPGGSRAAARSTAGSRSWRW